MPASEDSQQDALDTPKTADVHPYQFLTPETVLEAMESVGICTDARILALNSYENRVYQVGVEDGPPVIAKFYRPQRWTREQILEEHAFAKELADLEIPVVPPLLLNGRDSLYDYQGFSFSVFERRAGRAPDLDNPAGDGPLHRPRPCRGRHPAFSAPAGTDSVTVCHRES